VAEEVELFYAHLSLQKERWVTETAAYFPLLGVDSFVRRAVFHCSTFTFTSNAPSKATLLIKGKKALKKDKIWIVKFEIRNKNI